MKYVDEKSFYNPPPSSDEIVWVRTWLDGCSYSNCIKSNFYVDLMYTLKKIDDSNIFSTEFIFIISHYRKIGYNIIV